MTSSSPLNLPQPGRPDPVHDDASSSALWAIQVCQEAMPGVATPLTWTWFEGPAERAQHRACYWAGLGPRPSDRPPTSVDDRFLTIWFGHLSMNLERVQRALEPLSAGDAVGEQLFGESSTSTHDSSSKHRGGGRRVVARMKLPIAVERARRRLLRGQSRVTSWWQDAVATDRAGDIAGAQREVRRAAETLEAQMTAHVVTSFATTPLLDRLEKLCVVAGCPGLGMELLAGEPVDEAVMLADLWAVAHGERTLESFVHDHGFHGPGDAELSNRTWRENDAPLLPLLDAYRDRSGDESPMAMLERRREQRRQAEALLAAGLPRRADRLRARLLIGLARRYYPLRELGRANFLKAYDVTRCMARRIGAELARTGVLDDADDVFLLTVTEVCGDLPDDPKSEVIFRHERRSYYQQLRLPDTSVGQPRPELEDFSRIEHGDVVGIGASAGVVEGRALVVLTPDDGNDVMRGDILVCPTTDPGWSTFFLAVAAVVIDRGGPMSHGAILAREVGIPCVINTRDGTRRLRTGDLIRVDGAAGTVTVLANDDSDRTQHENSPFGPRSRVT